MPNFGWKCFIGSFLFSLAAVYASSKLYFLLPIEHDIPPQVSNFENIEAKNIDLFANIEETNPIIDKFNKLNQSSKTSEVNAPVTDNPQASSSAAESAKDIPEVQTAANDKNILYAPDDDFDDVLENTPKKSETVNSETDTASTLETSMEENSENTPSQLDKFAENSIEEEPLQIADASEAVPFTIPLVHNFQAPQQNVTISNEAENSQVALASNNVRLQNLGTVNKVASASVETLSSPSKQQPAENQDDPWTTAVVGNSHITKNKMEDFQKQHADEVSALNKEDVAEAKSANEKKVAYKMVKNILIPIPEEIANDQNLTPQLSYSEENKKLSEKLKKSGIIDSGDSDENNNKPEITPIPTQAQSESAENNKEPSTSSLTDSIAAWFSSPASKNNDAPKTETTDSAEKSSQSSAFSRLLGLGAKKDNNIAPSELKLAFQPNRAEISGQTLDWLKAFSTNAVNNDDVFVEIRIDGSSSFELQQKRLNLLYSILINNGVDYNKINIIFTDREPNSFIIRNIRYASEDDANKARKKAYSPWY